MCCERHIVWWLSPYKEHGAVCSSCASFGWLMGCVSLAVGGLILIIVLSNR